MGSTASTLNNSEGAKIPIADSENAANVAQAVM